MEINENEINDRVPELPQPQPTSDVKATVPDEKVVPVDHGIVTPGDLTEGIYVTVFEHIKDTFQDNIFAGFPGMNQKLDLSMYKGIPMRVKAICLPFVICHLDSVQPGLLGPLPTVQAVPIDTREVTLMQVPKAFYESFVGKVK